MAPYLTTLTPAELASYPLRAPPKGVQSNFGKAENNNKPMFVVMSFFLAIMIISFSNRIYTKSCIVQRYSWDDSKLYALVFGPIALLNSRFSDNYTRGRKSKKLLVT